jgi:hypothetical protein
MHVEAGEIACGYKVLAEVERGWRDLKRVRLFCSEGAVGAGWMRCRSWSLRTLGLGSGGGR